MNRVIFIVLLVILAVAAISLTTFVSFNPGPETTFQIKPDENTVLFGVTPWGDPRQVKEAYKPLLEYLSQRTGKKFQLLVMEDYEVAIENIVEGNIDISIISPVCYVRAKEREHGIQYISTIMRDNGSHRLDATFKGHLVALKSRFDGWSFEDFLKNSKKYNFAFVTKASASGWAYPMAMMKKNGIDPYSAFKSVAIFENHPSMTDAIAAGKLDLGATWEYNLEKARGKHGDIFSIIHTTHNIPGLSWVASKKVNHEFVKKIFQIQMELNSDSSQRELLLKDTPDKGWMAIGQEYYDEVEEVMKYVGEFK